MPSQPNPNEPLSPTAQHAATASPQPPAGRPVRGEWFPPKWHWILAAGAIVAVVWAQLPDSRDLAITNVVAQIAVAITVVAWLAWFFLGSRYGRFVKTAALVGVIVSVGVASQVRISGVTGWLSPTFAWRRSAPSALAPNLAQANNKNLVDLVSPTVDDFPQFLGPQRRGVVDHVRLDPQWSDRLWQPIWRQAIGGGWSGFAVVNGHAVTMEQHGDQEWVVCYDIQTGRVEWTHADTARHETFVGGFGPRATPTIDSGQVYTHGATGIVNCLDGRDGQVRWTVDLVKLAGTDATQEAANVTWGRAASPLVVESLVILPLGGRSEGPLVSLVALDRNTGEVVWKGGSDQISYSSPVVADLGGTQQVLIVSESRVTGHELATGKELWSHPWEGRSNANATVSQVVPISDRRLLLSKAYGVGGSLVEVTRSADDVWSVQALWHNKRILKTKYTNLVLHDRHVFALDDGILCCVEIETGERRWKQGRYGHGQLLLVGDFVLVQAENGEVVLVAADPQSHRELGRFQGVEGKTWNNPTLYGDLLLLRNSEEAACYRLPLQSADLGTGVTATP